MANDPESISSPKSFPQWMKSRIENRFDVDGAPFSPPSHDESFFYIRYPTTANSSQNTNENMSLSEQIQSNNLPFEKKAIQQNPGMISAAVKDFATADSKMHAAKVDISKHTEPCRQYLAGANSKTTLLPGQTKSLGTDDGFKGPGAACGSSIVRVAHQMVNNRPFQRGFTVANFDEADSEVDLTHRGTKSGAIATAEDELLLQQGKNMLRRGSKSLPASPMGSPKSIRKNPYFTGIFTTAQTNHENRGWFLSSLLGIQREQQSTQSSTTNIPEETETETMAYEATTSLGNTEKKSPITSVFRATKPSEIREMNFWSPTSM